MNIEYTHTIQNKDSANPSLYLKVKAENITLQAEEALTKEVFEHLQEYLIDIEEDLGELIENENPALHMSVVVQIHPKGQEHDLLVQRELREDKEVTNK
jgi:hypothetical protein